MTQMLFLRVGIDTGCGGTLAPHFSDGSFEYVPIPERKAVLPGRGVSFSDLPARQGGTLDAFAVQAGFAHHDPEFGTFTYGDPTGNKREQIRRLVPGDYLVFYSGFQGAGIARGTCFVIGYFVVAGVYQPPAGESWPPPSLEHLHGNAHFRRAVPEPELVVVRGDATQSRLLTKALPLSDGSFRRDVLPDVAEKIGFTGSVKRAIGRWVPTTHLPSAKAWLHKGV
jgi:hypothetical protein